MDDTRTAAIVEDFVEGLRDVIRRHRVTYAEYRCALDFLTETVGQGEFALLSDLLLEAIVDEAAQPDTEGTDSNVEGPFYVAGAPQLDADGRTPVLPMRPEEPGDRLLFTGAIRSTAGTALPSAVLDIWQADGDGLYSLPVTGNSPRRCTSPETRGWTRTWSAPRNPHWSPNSRRRPTPTTTHTGADSTSSSPKIQTISADSN